MMTAAQVQAVKRNLLAAQVSYKRSELNEKSLYVELHNFFQHLKKTVLHELREYWKDDDSILLEGQLDLILAPIFESQQEYYNILRKHNIKEYNSGCREARRLVKLARKNVSSHKSESNTIKTNNLLKLAVDKDELFGTNDWTQQRLLDQSFTASEGTMNRVDRDINKIISDGYQSGAGINKVAANIETRFEQLKTWEAKRIARTEIHNAHQMGIMNTYYDMGVEYTQWSSAHDSRVRGLKPKDKANHVKMDGEIIPLGGTYSNGLQYPGDTKGPIYEWINCRCGNVPFIIPDGYMAPPGMAQFREKDLIQTLDYWNEAELIDSIIDYSSPVKGVEIREVPLDSNVMTHEFAISPSKEIMNEFDISKKGMDTIHQFQKESFGSEIEMGIAFSENNGRIYTGKAIGTTDGVTIRTPKKCSTIHNHTDKSFNPPSGDDFYTYLKNGKERLGINVSSKETWVMQHKNKTGLSNKKINKLADKVDELSYEYSQKFKNEYRKEVKKIKKNITDPKLRQKELDNLKHKANNEWLDRYNKELGNEILKEASKFKGLKVKRFENIKINKKEVKDLPKLKKEKNNDSLLRRSKQIKNVPISKEKTEKAPSKIKDTRNGITSKIKSKLNNLFSLNKSPSKIKSGKFSSEKTKSLNAEEVFSKVDVSYTKKLMSKFKGIVKNQYLDDVLKHFEYFKKKLNAPNVNRNVEHCTIRKADRTLVEFYTTNEHENVGIPEDIQEEGRKKYIHTVIHSHPEGTSPISSPEDISKYAECGVINGISHNELGTMAITNNDVKGNKHRYKDIENKIEKIRGDMVEDFIKDENNNKPVDFENKNDVRRLNNYVNKHAKRYIPRYKKVLRKYKMKVKFNS